MYGGAFKVTKGMLDEFGEKGYQAISWTGLDVPVTNGVTADQNVNQCQVCKYFVCDGCTISHRCKNVKPTPPLRIA